MMRLGGFNLLRTVRPVVRVLHAEQHRACMVLPQRTAATQAALRTAGRLTSGMQVGSRRQAISL